MCVWLFSSLALSDDKHIIFFSNILFSLSYVRKAFQRGWDWEHFLQSPPRPSFSECFWRCSQEWSGSSLQYLAIPAQAQSVTSHCRHHSGVLWPLTRAAQCVTRPSSVSPSLVEDPAVLSHAVLPEGTGPVAGLCHLRTLPPSTSFAGLQHAGCSASWHVHPHAELVAGVCPPVCCWWPQHLLHSHRVHPSLPGEWEAPCSAAAPLGADCAQPEAGVRGVAVPEAGRAGASQRPVVWPHCLAAVHSTAAADDTGMPGQLRRSSQWLCFHIRGNIGTEQSSSATRDLKHNHGVIFLLAYCHFWHCQQLRAFSAHVQISPQSRVVSFVFLIASKTQIATALLSSNAVFQQQAWICNSCNEIRAGIYAPMHSNAHNLTDVVKLYVCLSTKFGPQYVHLFVSYSPFLDRPLLLSCLLLHSPSHTHILELHIKFLQIRFTLCGPNAEIQVHPQSIWTPLLMSIFINLAWGHFYSLFPIKGNKK